jgi:hypothetical protein
MVVDFNQYKATRKLVTFRQGKKTAARKKKEKRDAASAEILYLHQVIEGMVEALMFYAERTNYPAAITSDLGVKAKFALYGESCPLSLSTTI